MSPGSTRGARKLLRTGPRLPRLRVPRKLGAAELRPVAEALFHRRPEAVMALLRALWPQVVGPGVARRTELISVDHDMLRVRVPDARWRETLHRMEPTLLDRLSELGGRCAPRKLGFMIGAIREADTETGAPRQALDRSRIEARPSVQAMARVIADPEVRRAFVSCASLYLDRTSKKS